ncbi:MAG: alpha-L-fucosidase [Chlorobi bacterium]|nr:alpha-L-fucosidase [Chlorobiota bacterium]
MKRIIVLTVSLFVIFSVCAQNTGNKSMDKMWDNGTVSSANADSSKLKFFDEANYAMFIHWGLYSKLAGRWDGKTYYGISEWLMNPRRAGIPVDEYKEQARTFNPDKFNADSIVKLAKDAGMKYIIITAKHHDGFAMYNSKSNNFNVTATPFGRDPLKEMAEACKKEGLGFGFYYSHNQDWTFPGGNGGPETTPKGKKVGFDYYFKKKCLPQVNEITKNYGDIVLVWFDTPGDIEKKYAEQLVKVVRKNRPEALVSGRIGHGLGDYQTLGDMDIPLQNIPGYWETVDVTNDSWGYAWYDKNWKSPKRILENLISVVARGGTYMLNVGPKGDGSITEPVKIALTTSGKWIKKHPEVIYAAGASPWKHALPWGDVTVTPDGTMNVCVFQWPENGKLSLPGMLSGIKSAKVVYDDKFIDADIKIEEGSWITLKLPCQRPDNLVSVIKLEPDSIWVVDTTQAIDPYYTTDLSVVFAHTENCNKEEKRWMEKFGEWKHVWQVHDWTTDSKVTWTVDVKDKGYYHVDLNYSGEKRVVWQITTNEGDTLVNEQNACKVYKYYEMGLLKFKKGGKHKISVSLLSDDKNYSLKEIRIVPWNPKE